MWNDWKGSFPRVLRWVVWVSSLLCSAAFAQDTQAPSVPANPTATAASSTGIIVNWTASTDNVAVAGYDVELCQGAGCNSNYTTYGSAGAGRAIVGLTPATTYGFRVRARDAVPNYSAFTSMVYVTTHSSDAQAPTTPTNFTVVPGSSTSAVLNWTASTDNIAVTGYDIERCQGSGCNSSFTPFSSSAPGWANTGLTASTTYGYRIRARDAAPNYSAFTGIVYVTTPGAGDTQAPTTPTGFTAVAASSSAVVLNWINSTDNVAVTGYQVERCQGTGCNSSFTVFDLAPPAGWTNNSGLTPSTTYGYRVRARDAIPNYSAFTSIVYVTTQAAGGDTQAPTVPTNLTAIASSSTGIVVNWNASADNVAVTGYDVVLCQGTGCNSNYTTYGSAGAGRAIVNLTPATTYGVRVRAKDAVPNYSAYSSIVYVTTQGVDTTAPSVPINFTAAASSSTDVVLNWSASTDNVAVMGYQLERCQGSACNSSFTLIELTSAGWTNTGLAASTTYGYRLRAKDAVPNYSAYTSIVYVTTQAAGGDTQAPSVPGNLSATASSSTGVVVNWSSSTDNVAVTSYQVERCQGSGCNSSFTLFNISSAGWANTGLSPGTTYGYRVRARDAVPNYSAYTSIVYATTHSAGDTTAPSVPTNFSVSISSAGAVLSWTASTDNVEVTSYQIERCQGTNCNSSFTQFTASTSGWVNSGLAASTVYGYRIRAQDAASNYSAFTGIGYVTTAAATNDTQAPSVPTNLTVASNSASQVMIAWSASTDNTAVTGYELERCTGENCNSSFSRSDLTSTSYTDTGRVGGTTYGYRVRARDAVPNYSAFTTIAYVTTPAAGDTELPSTPTSLSITAVSGSLVLSWSAAMDNVGVDTYSIERCLASSCTFAPIASVAVPTYTDVNVGAQTYRYRIRSQDAAGNYSEYSSTVTGSTTSNAEIHNHVSYEYDKAGRLRRANHPDSKQIAYTLDAAGNRRQVQNAVPPGAPQSITVPDVSETGTYDISWVGPPAPQAVTSYQLFEADSLDFSPERWVSLPYGGEAPPEGGPVPTSTTIGAINAQPQGDYYYRVRACYQSVCGDYATDTTPIRVGNPPGVPGVLNVPAGTNYTGSLTLTWAASQPSPSGTYYELYRSSDSSFGSPTLLHSGGHQPVGVNNLDVGRYWFRVRACTSFGCSQYREGTNSVLVDRPAITISNLSVDGGGSISAQPSTERFIGFSYQLSPQGVWNVERYGQFVSISGQSHTTWLSPQVAMSQFEARATTTTCNQYPDYLHPDGIYNTWLNLGSARPGWGVSLFVPDRGAGCTITVEIKAVGQSQILGRSVINISLWSEQ